MIFLSSIPHGSNIEFVLAPMMAALAFLLAHSAVKPFDCGQQGVCIYSALIATPSTGKSPAINIIERLIARIEAHEKIKPKNSAITVVGTVEGLVNNLNNTPVMIGINYFI